MDKAIEVKGLTKVYGTGELALTVLKGIDVDVAPGEFVAVMGPSGSGKSTLMNILGALDRPTAGTYRLDGVDISRLNKTELASVRSEKIGFVFQSFNLLPRTTALDQVTLPLMYRRNGKVSGAERERRARVALAAVGLSERLHHRPSELSGGQQQRVAIARALVNDPRVIFADEPTGNLDTKASEEIMALLEQFRGRGITIVMVTHEPDIAEHADRVVCLRDGLVVSDGRDGSRYCLERATGGQR